MKIKRMSFRTKLILSFLISFLVVLSIVITIMYTITVKSIKQETSELGLKTTYLLKEKIESIKKDMYNMSITLSIDFDVNEVLRSNFKNNFQKQDYAADLMNNVFYKIVNSIEQDPYNVIIIKLDDDTIYLSDYINQEDLENFKQNYKNSYWYNDLLNSEENMKWYGCFDENKELFMLNSSSFMLVNKIYNLYSRTLIGLSLVIVDENYLVEGLDSVLSSEEKVFLVDENMQELARFGSNNNMNINKISLDESVIDNFSGYYTLQIENKEFQLSFYSSTDQSWKTIYLQPLEKVLSSVNEVNKYIILVFIGSILLSIIMVYLISIYFSKPIKALHIAIEKTSKGDLNSKAIKYYDDEIGDLAEGYNDMVDKLALLIHQKLEEQNKIKQNELQALRAQINPHFLYNTLATIRFILKFKTLKEVDRVILAFIKLLKKTISNDKEMITINEEIENLKEYIIIQKARYGDKFEIEYFIDEDVKECMIIKLLLQPLVENAFFHSFGNDNNEVKITISVFKENDSLIMLVEDNGKGMDKNTVNRINKGEKVSPQNGIGLSNVRDRIKLNFGEQYGIVADSELGVGSIISLVMPIMYS